MRSRMKRDDRFPWKNELSEIQRAVRSRPAPKPDRDATASSTSRKAYYILNVPMVQKSNLLTLAFWVRERGRSGEVGSLRPSVLSSKDISLFSESIDREILKILLQSSSVREIGREHV